MQMLQIQETVIICHPSVYSMYFFVSHPTICFFMFWWIGGWWRVVHCTYIYTFYDELYSYKKSLHILQHRASGGLQHVIDALPIVGLDESVIDIHDETDEEPDNPT